MTSAQSIFAQIATVRSVHLAARSHYLGDGTWEIREGDTSLGRGNSPVRAWLAAAVSLRSNLRAA